MNNRTGVLVGLALVSFMAVSLGACASVDLPKLYNDSTFSSISISPEKKAKVARQYRWADDLTELTGIPNKDGKIGLQGTGEIEPVGKPATLHDLSEAVAELPGLRSRLQERYGRGLTGSNPFVQKQLLADIAGFLETDAQSTIRDYARENLAGVVFERLPDDLLPYIEAVDFELYPLSNGTEVASKKLNLTGGTELAKVSVEGEYQRQDKTRVVFEDGQPLAIKILYVLHAQNIQTILAEEFKFGTKRLRLPYKFMYFPRVVVEREATQGGTLRVPNVASLGAEHSREYDRTLSFSFSDLILGQDHNFLVTTWKIEKLKKKKTFTTLTTYVGYRLLPGTEWYVPPFMMKYTKHDGPPTQEEVAVSTGYAFLALDEPGSHGVAPQPAFPAKLTHSVPLENAWRFYAIVFSTNDRDDDFGFTPLGDGLFLARPVAFVRVNEKELQFLLIAGYVSGSRKGKDTTSLVDSVLPSRQFRIKVMKSGEPTG